MKHIEWKDHCLYLLDQRLLPNTKEIVRCSTLQDICQMISTLGVRGAPAIGVAGAYAMVMAAEQYTPEIGDFQPYMELVNVKVASTRPTAVNLFWALDEMAKVWRESDTQNAPALLLERAKALEADDIARCREISRLGAGVMPSQGRILTHCNAGALATAGVGTALGVITEGHRRGKVEMVYADETRPLLQGARLTAYEMLEAGVPVTLITDNMAASIMAQGKINMVITGADRIAANGDAANKIGTYGLAVLASYHQIPFYIAAPLSTFDLTTATGRDIIIEERDGDEVRTLAGIYTAPKEVPVANPAFDVTPHSLITGIITEKGIIQGNFKEEIAKNF